MPKNKLLIEARNKRVTELYCQFKREGYSHDHICNAKMLEHNIFLTPRTIYAILSGEYDKEKKQST